jgi:putative ABC transport system permease protein
MRLRALFQSRRADDEFREELEFHLERETEKNVALGIVPGEARRVALVAFGGVTQHIEAHRDVRRPPWIEQTLQDIRFALRMFARSPVLMGAAVVTIAVGIGANAAIFSAVDAVILRPLPFHHQERLFLLAEENRERGSHLEMVSTANYLDWRDNVRAFENIAAYDYSPTGETLSGSGESRRIRVAEVTGNLFATLGVHAARGRTLEDPETWRAAPATLVLSDATWTREFGRDPAVIGRMLTLDGELVQIVGVMPPTFSFPHSDVDGWVSFRWDPSVVRSKEMWRRERWLRVVARLQPAASVDAAKAQLDAVAARLEREYPTTNANAGASITPLHSYLVGETRTPLLILLGAVGILMLIACGNVANLLLVQAAGRQRELALRLALGAAHARLVRQVVTESLLLSMIGAMGGLGLGWAGTGLFVALQPAGLLRVNEFGVNFTVTLYVALIATATGILFGLAPALWIRSRNPGDVLKQGARSETVSGVVRRFSDGLAASEVALALVISVGAALLVGSAKRLADVDPGFDARGVLMTSYVLYSHQYDSAVHRNAFHEEFLARARRIPGVTHAALGATPLEAYLWSSGVTIPGNLSAPSIEASHLYGTPDWPATLGIPVRQGRFFTDEDRQDLGRIVVNETFARIFFPGQNPIGRKVSFTKWDHGPRVFTIIGVIGDIRERSLMQPPGPAVVDQFVGFTSGEVLLRTAGNPEALVAPLRAILREMDPQIALGAARRLEARRDQEMARSRFFAAMLSVFASVGLLLAAVGVYGVLSQIARSRAREMGIRIALGARPSDVRWLVVRHGVGITVIGLTAGVAAALATSRVLSALLFDLAPNDPRSFASVVAILTATSVVASSVPAFRASRVDPIEVLHAD